MDFDETIQLLARGYTREQIAAIDAARTPEPEAKPRGRQRNS